MTITGTGHRPDKLNYEWDGIGPVSTYIREQLYKIIRNTKESIWMKGTSGPSERIKVISGMALGFDMILAEIAIDFKLELIAAIPCKGQSIRWPLKSRERYNRILAYEKCIQLCSPMGLYTRTCMQDRNIWMINEMLKDPNHQLIGCFDGSPGGTNNCLRYAASKAVIPIIIDPYKKTVTH